MDGNETDKRIYVGECGCVQVESKHFRLTMQPEQFVEILREIIKRQGEIPTFYNRLSISNNVDSTGFVSIQNVEKRRKF